MNIRYKDVYPLRFIIFFTVSLSFILRLATLNYQDLIPEEAYYWNYSRHLDFSFLDHPPMVAIFIKLGTTLFGVNPFAVRILSLAGWVGTAFFSYKLSEFIRSGTGVYAVFLLSFLPFFFIHSIYITPDQPLVLCWAAALYCLYRALVMDDLRFWYGAGISIGLGMLSKYTIILLLPAILCYFAFVPSAACCLLRRAPWVAALIAILLFSPVIYWNLTHDWASFIFQGPRRFQEQSVFTLPHFLGLVLLFLLPIGMIECFQLFQTHTSLDMEKKTQRFIQIFSVLPLLFFGIFSLGHQIKFNWIGPALLAIIPWFASRIKTGNRFHYRAWAFWAVTMLFVYEALYCIIAFGYPPALNRYFSSFLNWQGFSQQMYAIAQQVEQTSAKKPVFISLEPYRLNSELTFYQTKAFIEKINQQVYPVAGRDVFDLNSLMYYYWSKSLNLSDKQLIIISDHKEYLNDYKITGKINIQSPVMQVWAKSQYSNHNLKAFYYITGELKPALASNMLNR